MHKKGSRFGFARVIFRPSLLLVLLALALTGALLLGCAAPAESDDARLKVPSGAVSSAHPLATAAGIDVLEAGGNAFDAAVAVAAVLTVVEPMNSNLLGGYGSLIVYDAQTGTTRYLDNNGRFPQATNSDVFRAAENRGAIMRTAQAVSTPGNLSGFEMLWKEYGTKPWAELLQPAIEHAENGIEVSAPLARAIASTWDYFSDYTRAFYGSDGEPLAAGDRLVQKDLAASLSVVAAKGSPALHGGSLGQALDREMKKRGGFLALADLEAHHSEWLDPFSIDYRGATVYTAGPPSNSFASLVCLNVMSQFDNQASGHNTVSTLHHFAEATKHAFWARLAYAGGPEVSPPPLEHLLSPEYGQKVAATIGDRASSFEPPQGKEATAESESTTHYVVADRDGNVVSATITLGHGFGSAVMVEGAGFWLNNSMAYSTYEPKGNPMDAIPGARKHSSKTPTLILRDGLPWVAIGTPGGHTIPQTTPQMVMNLVDFEMDLADALAAPRIAFAEPDRLLVESQVGDEVLGGLESLGHHVVANRGLGLAHALRIERHADGSVSGFAAAADPRGIGTALVASSGVASGSTNEDSGH